MSRLYGSSSEAFWHSDSKSASICAPARFTQNAQRRTNCGIVSRLDVFLEKNEVISMKRYLSLCLIFLPSAALSQTSQSRATYVATIPTGQRVIDFLTVPKSGCAVGIFEDDYPPRNPVTPNESVRHIHVSPGSVSGKASSPVQLTYDGSYICKGQAIANAAGTPMAFNQDTKPISPPPDNGWIAVGTVDWGDSIEGLTRTYGVVSHTYNSPGPRTIRIQLDLLCIDFGASVNTCPNRATRSVSVPAQITP
jgi:hypothetical protein